MKLELLYNAPEVKSEYFVLRKTEFVVIFHYYTPRLVLNTSVVMFEFVEIGW